jgi:hypothetical protein
MDLVTVTGFRTVSELMDDETGMDQFEYMCWQKYWKENLFGPFADNWLLSQVAGHAASAFGGGRWKVDEYMLKIRDPKTEPVQMSEVEQESVAYEVMRVFGGVEKAEQWKRGAQNN